MARYIFLDTERTGLDTDGWDQITEIAWIIPRISVERHLYVRHSRLPNEWVLNSTDYLTRILPTPNKVEIGDAIAHLCSDVASICNPPERAYLVAANPSFDDRALRSQGLKQPPYHYHLIDVEVMAMGVLGLESPPHLTDLPALLGLSPNSAPHTALEDARTVKRCFEALCEVQRLTINVVRNSPL